MTVFGLIYSIMKAIPIFDVWGSRFIAWYIMQIKSSAASAFTDAVEAQFTAKNDDDRLKALDLWQKALTHERIEP